MPTTRRSVLLIAGCWMLIAAALASPTSRTLEQLDVRALLIRCVGEAAFGMAVVSTLLIVSFGDSKACERLGYFMTALVVVPASVVVSRRFAPAVAGLEGRTSPQAVAPLVPLPVTIVALCAARLSGIAHTSAKLLILLAALRSAAEMMQRVPALVTLLRQYGLSVVRPVQ